MLIAATGKDVCSVKLGDDLGRAQELLAEEFSEADIVEATSLPEVKNAILEFIDGEPASRACRSTSAAPCSSAACGTSCAASRAARPAPTRRSRKAIGAPAAVRAVGSACGANPVALVVPCHRAVRTDGGLGGYAWGLGRKKKLLGLEKKY